MKQLFEVAVLTPYTRRHYPSGSGYEDHAKVVQIVSKNVTSHLSFQESVSGHVTHQLFPNDRYSETASIKDTRNTKGSDLASWTSVPPLGVNGSLINAPMNVEYQLPNLNYLEHQIFENTRDGQAGGPTLGIRSLMDSDPRHGTLQLHPISGFSEASAIRNARNGQSADVTSWTSVTRPGISGANTEQTWNVENAASVSGCSSRDSISSMATGSVAWSTDSLRSRDSENDLVHAPGGGNATGYVLHPRKTGFFEISFASKADFGGSSSPCVSEKLDFADVLKKKTDKNPCAMSGSEALTDNHLEQMLARVAKDLSALEAKTSEENLWQASLSTSSETYTAAQTCSTSQAPRSNGANQGLFSDAVTQPEAWSFQALEFPLESANSECEGSSQVALHEGELCGSSDLGGGQVVRSCDQVSRSSSGSSLFASLGSTSEENLADVESCENFDDFKIRKLKRKAKSSNLVPNVIAHPNPVSANVTRAKPRANKHACKDVTSVDVADEVESSRSTSGFSEIIFRQLTYSDSETPGLNPYSKPFVPRAQLQSTLQTIQPNFATVLQQTDNGHLTSTFNSLSFPRTFYNSSQLCDSGMGATFFTCNDSDNTNGYLVGTFNDSVYLNETPAQYDKSENVNLTGSNNPVFHEEVPINDLPLYDCRLDHGLEFTPIQDLDVHKMPPGYQTWQTLQTIFTISNRVVKIRVRKPFKIRLNQTSDSHVSFGAKLDSKIAGGQDEDDPVYDHYGTGFVCHLDKDCVVVRTHSEVVGTSLEASQSDVIFHVNLSDQRQSPPIRCSGQSEGFSSNLHSQATKFMCKTPAELLPHLHVFENVPVVRRASLFSDSCYFTECSPDNSTSEREDNDQLMKDIAFFEEVYGPKPEKYFAQNQEACNLLPEDDNRGTLKIGDSIQHETDSDRHASLGQSIQRETDSDRHASLGQSIQRETYSDRHASLGQSIQRETDSDRHASLGQSIQRETDSDRHASLGQSIQRETDYDRHASLGQSIQRETDSDRNANLGQSIQRETYSDRNANLGQSIQRETDSDRNANLGQSIQRETDSDRNANLGLPVNYNSSLTNNEFPTELFQWDKGNKFGTHKDDLLSQTSGIYDKSCPDVLLRAGWETSNLGTDLYESIFARENTFAHETADKIMCQTFEACDQRGSHLSSFPLGNSGKMQSNDLPGVLQTPTLKKASSGVSSPLVIMERKFDSLRKVCRGMDCPYAGQKTFGIGGDYTNFSSYAGDVFSSFAKIGLPTSPTLTEDPPDKGRWEYESLIYAQNHQRQAYNQSYRPLTHRGFSVAIDSEVSMKGDKNESSPSSCSGDTEEPKPGIISASINERVPETTGSGNIFIKGENLDHSNSSELPKPACSSHHLSELSENEKYLTANKNDNSKVPRDIFSEFSSREAYLETWDRDLLNLDEDLNPLLQFDHLEEMINNLLADDDSGLGSDLVPGCCPETHLTNPDFIDSRTSKKHHSFCLVISYPHAGPKMVSTGLFSRHHHVGGTLYDTPTCMGSCGAPVIAMSEDVSIPYITHYVHAGTVKVNDISTGAGVTYFDQTLPTMS